jgi:hypothetical protein
MQTAGTLPKEKPMPALLKHTKCPACGHRHHFCFVIGEMAEGCEYDYVCPETGKTASLRPNAWESVEVVPQGAVELIEAEYAPARDGGSRAGPTQLQDVLPEVNTLAGKVGGLEHLSEIVDTLKDTKKE